jgi:hypothetical protein
MSFTIIWRCDGEACDRKEETNGPVPATMGEIDVIVGQTQIWHGHLCNSCRDKLTQMVAQTMRTWVQTK